MPPHTVGKFLSKPRFNPHMEILCIKKKKKMFSRIFITKEDPYYKHPT